MTTSTFTSNVGTLLAYVNRTHNLYMLKESVYGVYKYDMWDFDTFYDNVVRFIDTASMQYRSRVDVNFHLNDDEKSQAVALVCGGCKK